MPVVDFALSALSFVTAIRALNSPKLGIRRRHEQRSRHRRRSARGWSGLHLRCGRPRPHQRLRQGQSRGRARTDRSPGTRPRRRNGPRKPALTGDGCPPASRGPSPFSSPAPRATTTGWLDSPFTFSSCSAHRPSHPASFFFPRTPPVCCRRPRFLFQPDAEPHCPRGLLPEDRRSVVERPHRARAGTEGVAPEGPV